MSTKEQRTVRGLCSQGDVDITPTTDEIPSDALKHARENGAIIVTHSETGHHHVIEHPDVVMYDDKTNELISWLEVTCELAELKHLRSHDTHESLFLPKGRYKIGRQREYTPSGWRKVQD